ncbi:MAG: ABC transporter ATP-binding protein, partial [Parvibaculaceae bacterium]
VTPTSGDLLMSGRSIATLLPEQRNFGMVFQGYALFPHMTVAGNIAYPLEVRKQPRSEIDARVAEMLELVQLTKFADRYPRQLSGGQQQRVALARALSFGPELLLLDEPLGALDRKLRGEVQDQLKDLHEKTGATFVYVTHDQEEALSMSDRVAIMRGGRIVQLGTPQDLYDRPTSAFVADFLGKSNFVEAAVVGERNGELDLEIHGHRLVHAGPVASRGSRAVALAVRPERIGLSDTPNVPDTNRLEGRINRITYLGSMFEVQVDAGPVGHFLVHSSAWHNRSRFRQGQTVWLHWPKDAGVVVTRD